MLKVVVLCTGCGEASEHEADTVKIKRFKDASSYCLYLCPHCNTHQGQSLSPRITRFMAGAGVEIVEDKPPINGVDVRAFISAMGSDSIFAEALNDLIDD